MGINEKFDVVDIMHELKSRFKLEEFCLWGRSMGAATALCAYPLVNTVVALVLDSPFGLVRDVYSNAVKQAFPVPGIAIDMIYQYASKEIQLRYGFDVNQVRPFDVGS